MSNIKRYINNIEYYITSFFLISMVIVIFMQVFSRYVLSSSPAWGEELARFLFIWIIYVGSSYAVKENRHLAITSFRDWLSPNLKKYVTLVAELCSLIFSIIAVIYGIKMTMFIHGTGQSSPGLGLEMYWVYLSLPVGFILISVRLILNIMTRYSNKI